MNRSRLPLLLALMTLASAAFAHEGAKDGKRAETVSTQEKAFGREGDRRKLSRTIRVKMSDSMRFAPDTLQIKLGETIRFVVSNSGKLTHEMVLGTMEDLRQHAELMKRHPGMEHDEPYMIHVASGKTQTMVWQFTKTGEFHYGCLVPGHFEAGMVGKLIVK